MKISTEMKTWLGDKCAQARTLKHITHFARQWEGGEIKSHIRALLDAVAEPTAREISDMVVDLFGDTQWVDRAIADLIGEAARDDYFEPPFPNLRSEIHSGILLFEDERLSIAAGVTNLSDLAFKKANRKGPASVGLTSNITVLKLLKGNGVRISLWKADAADSDFTCTEAGVCAKTGERPFQPGEVFVIDGRRESFVIESAQSDLVLLQAVIKVDAAPLLIEFDSDTGRYVGASSADEAASRVQMLATLVRMVAPAKAIAILRPHLADRHFFVRWHIMREMMAIDVREALPDLERLATDDPHGDVREAAALTHADLTQRFPELKGAIPCHA